MLLVVGQHHRDPVPQGEVFPGDIESLAIFVRPDRADAGPDFLALLVFARGLAVVDEVRRGVRHRNAVRDTASSVRDWHDMSTQGGAARQGRSTG